MAAGQGNRLGLGVPKAMMGRGGRPLFLEPLAVLAGLPGVMGGAVVVPPGWEEEAGRWLAPYPSFQAVSGGAQRHDSVWAGLAHRPREAAVVLVHDAARPFLPWEVAETCLREGSRWGGAVASLPAADTMALLGEGDAIEEVPARSRLRLLQTPQAFRASLLEGAHRWFRETRPSLEVTDDVGLVLAYLKAHPEEGGRIVAVQGSFDLRKVTYPEDWAWAQRKGPAFRVGLGYDIHRLVEGRPLFLGGVEIPYDKGLLGHSDADVLCHAVADALLGAAALGDIGQHFPDDDPRFAGASSWHLLQRVAEMVGEAGWEIASVDAVVVAEAPRLQPYRQAMAEEMARAMGTLPSQVAVKATTHEGMGPQGRGEAISAQAVALLVRKQEGAMG
ncbi:MAG: 2-C-methyl-D-erythritol 2,4-cyclodiphosphate synthase [Bacillota bacterium]|nr:2-C-methyl-D-erythritol 2,4-cyclodiphosphate synthase [Bacillota bacterium]